MSILGGVFLVLGINVVPMLVTMVLGRIPVQDSGDTAMHLHPVRGRIGWLEIETHSIAG